MEKFLALLARLALKVLYWLRALAMKLPRKLSFPLVAGIMFLVVLIQSCT